MTVGSKRTDAGRQTIIVTYRAGGDVVDVDDVRQSLTKFLCLAVLGSHLSPFYGDCPQAVLCLDGFCNGFILQGFRYLIASCPRTAAFVWSFHMFISSGTK